MKEMVSDIVMPNLGFDMREALLVEWLKQRGERVAKGESIALVESDKANVELESVATGEVLELLYEAGQEVPVGAVIARVGPASAVTAPPASDAKQRPTPTISPVARRFANAHDLNLDQIAGSGPRGRIHKQDVEAYLSKSSTTKGAGSKRAGAVRALPKVRRLAREQGIDLIHVLATGKHGQVTRSDLEAYRRETEQAPSDPTLTPALAGVPEGVREVTRSRTQLAAASRLAESMRQAPHFFVTSEMDLEAALDRLEAMRAPQPRINDLLQYITVRTLQQVPALNATLQDDRLYHYDNVNLAIAVAREDGLIAPVLRAAERYSLTGLAEETRLLVQRARTNQLHPEDLQQGTFTISNLGVVSQVERFTAVINPPQVAILAVGAMRPRPVVIGGGLHFHRTAYLTLSGDHRVVDGMDLARFMTVFEKELDRFSQG